MTDPRTIRIPITTPETPQPDSYPEPRKPFLDRLTRRTETILAVVAVVLFIGVSGLLLGAVFNLAGDVFGIGGGQ